MQTGKQAEGRRQDCRKGAACRKVRTVGTVGRQAGMQGRQAGMHARRHAGRQEGRYRRQEGRKPCREASRHAGRQGGRQAGGGYSTDLGYIVRYVQSRADEGGDESATDLPYEYD